VEDEDQFELDFTEDYTPTSMVQSNGKMLAFFSVDEITSDMDKFLRGVFVRAQVDDDFVNELIEYGEAPVTSTQVN